MSPVFGHGQLRLYLLALLSDGERHGYEIIRALEDRFDGLYSPSAGTVYPRLAKLESDGLVERREDGRKAIYRITDAGRAEVRARDDDVADLESDLDRSAADLAADLRTRVSAGSAGLRDEMRAAAKAARASARPASGGSRREREAADGPSSARTSTDDVTAVEALLAELRTAARRRVRKNPDPGVVAQVRSTLDEALRAIESLPG